MADEWRGLEPVSGGLPEWLEGKVDTAQIAAATGRAAIADGGGNLWLSRSESDSWERIAPSEAVSASRAAWLE